MIEGTQQKTGLPTRGVSRVMGKRRGDGVNETESEAIGRGNEIRLDVRTSEEMKGMIENAECSEYIREYFSAGIGVL